MASNKSVYLNGTQVGFGVSSAASSGYSRLRDIIQLDWGSAPAEIFLRPRPLRDGAIRRGRRHQPRNVYMQLGVKVSAAGMTAVKSEAARDDEWEAIQALLPPESGLFTIKQTRVDYANTAISREILGELEEYRAWVWSPDDVDDGYVGRHDGSTLVLPLNFICPFPWFMDTTGTTVVNAQTLDGTLRSTTGIVNPGIVQCGVRIEITAASGTATVAINNSTAPTSAGVAAATLNSISPTATPVILDWFYTSPLEWTLTQGASDLAAKLNTGSSVGLTVGTNTVTYQVTSGSLTSGVITVKARYLWGNP